MNVGMKILNSFMLLQGVGKQKILFGARDGAGVEHYDFDGKASCGVTHFENLFKAPIQASIAEVIRVAQLFPRFSNEEDNRRLMSPVDEEELKKVLGSFQKDKSPGPDGWTIEFFQGFYEILGLDLLQVVKDTRTTGIIPASFNATFIALIPKTDN